MNRRNEGDCPRQAPHEPPPTPSLSHARPAQGTRRSRRAFPCERPSARVAWTGTRGGTSLSLPSLRSHYAPGRAGKSGAPRFMFVWRRDLARCASRAAAVGHLNVYARLICDGVRIECNRCHFKLALSCWRWPPQASQRASAARRTRCGQSAAEPRAAAGARVALLRRASVGKSSGRRFAARLHAQQGRG